MFDLGWQEFMLIAFVAVVVVGPRDLPRVVRSVSIYMRKARTVARDFQNSLEEVAREAELDELRKEAKNFSGRNIEKSISNLVDPEGDTRKEMERIANQARDAASSRPAETVSTEAKSESLPDRKFEGAESSTEVNPVKTDGKSAQESAAAGQ